MNIICFLLGHKFYKKNLHYFCKRCKHKASDYEEHDIWGHGEMK